MRDFFIHNARYWIEEFHLDGLRIDAVHAMHDRSATHFADELAQAVRAGAGTERQVHLVLENHANDARRLARSAAGGALLADAQWNDDLHHAMHVLATGETDGYYSDYAADPLGDLGRALAEGFVFQGQASAFAQGQLRGTPSAGLPPLAFVNAIQTHDQVGNRAFGERIAALALAADRGPTLRALLACLLLSPAPPMLFMGEEFAASTPFLYFCDFAGDLARAVTEGRRAEFGGFAMFAEPALRARIPDPNAPSSFDRSKLNWQERHADGHASWWALYRDLLALRRDHLVPLLPQARSGRCSQPAPGCLHLQWPLGPHGHWHLRANLSAQAVAGLPALPGRSVHASAADGAGLAAWSVQVTLEPA